MLLMVEKGIRGGICQAVHRQAKTNNEYMKNYDKDITPSYIMYVDVNNLYGWVISQKMVLNGQKNQDYQDLMRDSYKPIMKIVIEDIFLKQMLSIRKICVIFLRIYHFFRKEKKIKKQKN